MQRIVGVDIGKNNLESSEYISKKLCFSIILTVTFLSVIGGYFLGKFVSDKTNLNYGSNFHEMSKTVNVLNQNFQQTFQYQRYNNTYPYKDVHFLRCNFSMIGQNESGQLTAVNYLNMLNSCFDIW